MSALVLAFRNPSPAKRRQGQQRQKSLPPLRAAAIDSWPTSVQGLKLQRLALEQPFAMGVLEKWVDGLFDLAARAEQKNGGAK